MYQKDEKPQAIVDYIERTSKKETSTITLKDCFYDPLYRRATLTAIAVILFHEMTGENAIMLYSTEIFKKMDSYQDGYDLSPRNGTILIGVFNLIAHLPAVYLINKLPRRTLLITGHVLIAFSHLMVGIFAASTNDNGVITMILLFMIIYVITNGPIIWLYVSEIVVDAGLSACLFILWTLVLLLSLFTHPLMDSFLKPQGVFWLFGVTSGIGAWFTWKYVKETNGLSDKEKKMLY